MAIGHVAIERIERLIVKQYSHLPSAGLVALDRDLAKQLFGIRDAPQRLQFVQSLMTSHSGSKDCSTRLSFDNTWTELHAVLCEIDPPPTGDDSLPPLTMALAGGRPLHIEAESLVTMLRPDLVPVVADAIQAIHEHDIRTASQAATVKSDGGKPHSAVRFAATIDQMKQFYQEAKQTHSAVVFAAWSS